MSSPLHCPLLALGRTWQRGTEWDSPLALGATVGGAVDKTGESRIGCRKAELGVGMALPWAFWVFLGVYRKSTGRNWGQAK